MIFENIEIRIRGFLIERKLEIRRVYLKFKGFCFGWGSLVGLPMV